MKALALLSGGLDSTLAIKVILNQNIGVSCINFTSPFFQGSYPERIADRFGVSLKIVKLEDDYLKMLKNPKYGYGRNINPCIDCKIFIFKKAKDYMEKIKAKFIITGEVLGERPMSQKKDVMRLIEKESGLSGIVLRPLSAKLLAKTKPEIEGWVNREKLLAISGRSRKPQIKLASEFGIKDYPTPAGGCLLTDPGFAFRMKDLMKHSPNFGLNNIELLKIGRHFRLSPYFKLVIGRNEMENIRLKGLALDSDIIFEPENGLLGLGRGEFDEEELLLSSKIIAKYCDGKTMVSIQSKEIKRQITADKEENIKKWMIVPKI
ncbi:MAG: tRNA 4-thiouridine(8) synthase ThiI [bacterium]